MSLIIRNFKNNSKNLDYFSFFFLAKLLILISLISQCNSNFLLLFLFLSLFFVFAQSAGAVEYTDCTSAER